MIDRAEDLKKGLHRKTHDGLHAGNELLRIFLGNVRLKGQLAKFLFAPYDLGSGADDDRALGGVDDPVVLEKRRHVIAHVCADPEDSLFVRREGIPGKLDGKLGKRAYACFIEPRRNAGKCRQGADDVAKVGFRHHNTSKR